ncbi:MAG TPA: hypothetical protein VK666_23195 [Chryseolinea sp.]|nr:hypothetical protein [Chryseolinea sp.]
MNIYVELAKSAIRLKIDSDDVQIKIPPDFYTKIKGTSTYKMFLDSASNNKVKHFITHRRNNLGFYGKLRYIFMRNTVLVMVDHDVQELMTIRLIHAYATLSFDARVVYVLRKSGSFADMNLDAIEVYKELCLNNGRLNEDVPISKL